MRISRDLFKMAKFRQRDVFLLSKQIQDPHIMGDHNQQTSLLSKVLACLNQGLDLSQLLPTMVKLLAHRDLCIKKMAGEILIQHSHEHSEMVLLAINTLVQDTQESNPLVRGLALRTLSSLHHEFVIEHLEAKVLRALSDKSAYVRRVAVLACIKLHRMSASSVSKSGMIDLLYGMIRDLDPLVVVNCLSALEEILKDEGGIVINKALSHHLLKHLHIYPTWSQVKVLETLKKYIPTNEDEVLAIMNAADFCLENNSSAVVTMCIQLFIHLLGNQPDLHSEVCRRSGSILIKHLSLGNVELTYGLISFILLAQHEAPSHFRQHFLSFFCRNKDPDYLKIKKIRLLPQLIIEENGTNILEELSLYCMSASQDVSLAAMRAIRLAYQEKQFLSEACLSTLSSLMQSSSPHILSNLLQVLQDMQIADNEFWEKLIASVSLNFDSVTDNSGKAALLFLIGEHLQGAEYALTVIQNCVDEFVELNDRDVKIQLLNSTAKMFLAHPFELQSVLGELLELADADPDLEVKSRTHFLYCLLESGIYTAKIVLLDTVM